jgi:hypothetical protein
MSEPVQVFTAKDYPGVMETPPLVRYLANQGAKLVVRETQYRQRYFANSPTEASDVTASPSHREQLSSPTNVINKDVDL